MLPALPTGTQCRSGARPSASQISNAAVFCPCSRNGFTQFTSVTDSARPGPARARASASKLPSTSSTRAPCTRVCAILPIATLPFGTRTAHVRPAFAAYAAADGAGVAGRGAHDRLRALLERLARWPASCPRSLNEPVGFAPSYFSQTSQPVSADSGSAAHERRAALAQGDHRRGVGDGQAVAVLLDQAAPLVRPGRRGSLLALHAEEALHARRPSSSRSSCRVFWKAPSCARCVMNTSVASSPEPSCHTRSIETPLRPKRVGDLGQDARPVLHVQVQVVLAGRVVHRPDARGRGGTCIRRRAAARSGGAPP